MTLSSDFVHQSTVPNGGVAAESFKWAKLSDFHKRAYTESMTTLLGFRLMQLSAYPVLTPVTAIIHYVNKVYSWNIAIL